MRRSVLRALILVLLLPSLPITGQSIPAFASDGDSVRVHLSDESVWTGQLVKVEASTFTVLVNNREQEIARERIRSFERHREANRLRKFAVPTLIGASVGVLLGLFTYEECVPRTFSGFDCVVYPSSPASSALIGGVALGAIGGVVGALRALAARSGWEPVRLPDVSGYLELSTTPLGGTGIGFSIPLGASGRGRLP